MSNWWKSREYILNKTGKLNLTGIQVTEFSVVKSRPLMKELNISRCPCTSLKKLAFQPNLYTFNAEGSSLSSFENFSSVSKATVFHLKNTPLSAKPHYVLALYIICDNPKIVVDGKLISSKVKRLAGTYPICTKDLLNAGWDLVYPCPSSDEIRDLCRDLNVTYIEDEHEEEQVDEESAYQEEDLNHYEMIEKMLAKHDSIIQQAQHKFGLLQNQLETTFEDKLKNTLQNHNIIVENDQDSFCEAIRHLISIRKSA